MKKLLTLQVILFTSLALLAACDEKTDRKLSNDKGTVESSYSLGESSSSTPTSSSEMARTAAIVALPPVVKGTMTDARDGMTYKTVTIGTQTWMAQNLNYDYNEGTAKSNCYNNSVDSCAKYGRLYTWAAAMDSAALFSTAGKDCGYDNICSPSGTVRGVCPEGWHLPDDAEWNTLMTAVGGERTAGKKLKTTSGWYESSNGYDFYGFGVLPAGFLSSNGSFVSVGYNTYLWSSSERGSYYADNWNIGATSDSASCIYSNKYLEFSVRCLKD